MEFTICLSLVSDRTGWFNIKNMNQNHMWHTASLLIDGKVLVAGGSSGEGYVIF
jgi:hypothetical protein